METKPLVEHQARDVPWIIKSLLDVDFYKLTMLQFIWWFFADKIGTFRFKNRTDVKLGDYIDITELRRQLKHVCDVGIPPELLAKLGEQYGHIFRPAFIAWLGELKLPMPTVRLTEDGDLDISVTGNWVLITLWETIVMNIVNELYFICKMNELGLDEEDVLAEGRRRLMAKIERLKAYPDIKITDFGNRRHFSRSWHKEVLETLIREIPDQLVGASHVALALELGIPAIGTIAHEMDMAFQALNHELDDQEGRLVGHEQFMHMWEEFYGPHVLTALTDTYGSKYFFEHFAAFAKSWAAVRHDSGDPFEWGHSVIDWYRTQAINPQEKRLVFSDGLDLDFIIRLYLHFVGTALLGFGWGTNLTNDMGFHDWPDGNRGLKPLSIVMKLVILCGINLVKISDNRAKTQGETEAVERVLRLSGFDLASQSDEVCDV